MNKFVSGDLDHVLPKIKFADNNVCDTCVKKK